MPIERRWPSKVAYPNTGGGRGRELPTSFAMSRWWDDSLEPYHIIDAVIVSEARPEDDERGREIALAGGSVVATVGSGKRTSEAKVRDTW